MVIAKSSQRAELARFFNACIYEFRYYELSVETQTTAIPIILFLNYYIEYHTSHLEFSVDQYCIRQE